MQPIVAHKSTPPRRTPVPSQRLDGIIPARPEGCSSLGLRASAERGTPPPPPRRRSTRSSSTRRWWLRRRAAVAVAVAAEAERAAGGESGHVEGRERRHPPGALGKSQAAASRRRVRRRHRLARAAVHPVPVPALHFVLVVVVVVVSLDIDFGFPGGFLSAAAAAAAAARVVLSACSSSRSSRTTAGPSRSFPEGRGMPPHRRLRGNCLPRPPRSFWQDQLGGPRHASHAEQLRQERRAGRRDGGWRPRRGGRGGRRGREERQQPPRTPLVTDVLTSSMAPRGTATSTSRIFKPAPTASPAAAVPPSLRRCPLRPSKPSAHLSHPSWSTRLALGVASPSLESSLAGVPSQGIVQVPSMILGSRPSPQSSPGVAKSGTRMWSRTSSPCDRSKEGVKRR